MSKFSSENILQHVIENWNGYISSVYWGIYPDKKSPEMVVAEYYKILFTTINEYNRNNKNRYLEKNVFIPAPKQFQEFIPKNISFEKQIKIIEEITGKLFDFYSYEEYIGYINYIRKNTIINSEILCKEFLIKKYEKIKDYINYLKEEEDLKKQENSRLYIFDN